MVKLDAGAGKSARGALAASGAEGQIIAELSGDEAFDVARIGIRDGLPKSPAGKILRGKLISAEYDKT